MRAGGEQVLNCFYVCFEGPRRQEKLTVGAAPSDPLDLIDIGDYDMNVASVVDLAPMTDPLASISSEDFKMFGDDANGVLAARTWADRVVEWTFQDEARVQRWLLWAQSPIPIGGDCTGAYVGWHCFASLTSAFTKRGIDLQFTNVMGSEDPGPNGNSARKFCSQNSKPKVMFDVSAWKNGEAFVV